MSRIAAVGNETRIKRRLSAGWPRGGGLRCDSIFLIRAGAAHRNEFCHSRGCARGPIVLTAIADAGVAPVVMLCIQATYD
jgi:hypothetical protein